MAKITFLPLRANISKKGRAYGHLLVFDISRLDLCMITTTVTAECCILIDHFIVWAVTNAYKND